MRVQCLVQAVVVAGLVIVSPKVWADDTAQLKDQVQALQDKVDQLEGQLANKQQASASGVMPLYDQWEDPFAQMMMFNQQMERNLRQAMAGSAVYSPRMDMKQTDKEYVITMDVPGMDKDKINVQIKHGTLIISGERESETKDNKNNQYYRQERSFGSFMQAIPLPEDAKTDRIEAKYKNGVLTVTVGREKKEDREGQKIDIQ